LKSKQGRDKAAGVNEYGMLRKEEVYGANLKVGVLAFSASIS
jgi:hypothetical protein